MKIMKDSHLDHGLTAAQVEYIKTRFADKHEFCIETFELPEGLGLVPCGLHGPVMGDASVSEDEVYYKARGDRPYSSRLIDRAPRLQRKITVIMGPHEEECECGGKGGMYIPLDGGFSRTGNPGSGCMYCLNGSGKIKHACILYTAFGGPLTPKEPGDAALSGEERQESFKFWSQHALSANGA
jgi:hypothetical protein